MRRATRLTATVFGVFAGAAGIEHGVFEILQGRTRPEGLMIASIGPPCVPEQSWNSCEPAMTVVPDFLITGILAVVLGLLVLLWSSLFLKRDLGGWVLVGLSVVLLLFGGGIFPPVIGVVAGIMGVKISKPVVSGSRFSGAGGRVLSALWPVSLAVFILWILGQWLLGYFFNDWLLANGYLIIIMVLGTLILSVLTAYARDVHVEALAA